jgi:hemoglobin-like flavoprotein
MELIDVAVQGLGQPELSVPALQGLGQRHGVYGVKPEHFDTVGAALLWTLGQGLGDDFTPNIEAAWTETYGLLSDVMKQAIPVA